MMNRKLRPLAEKWSKIRLKFHSIYGIRQVMGLYEAHTSHSICLSLNEWKRKLMERIKQVTLSYPEVQVTYRSPLGEYMSSLGKYRLPQHLESLQFTIDNHSLRQFDLRVTIIGYLRATVIHIRVTISYLWFTLGLGNLSDSEGHFRLTLCYYRIPIGHPFSALYFSCFKKT